jgi:diguanylate cyclase (GGDEF)-like protein/PAS domain S-box-containing protein
MHATGVSRQAVAKGDIRMANDTQSHGGRRRSDHAPAAEPAAADHGSVPLPHSWRVWAIALGAPLAVTALGLFVDDRRIGFPVLLYLLGVVAAISVGRIAAGVVAGVASGVGLAVLLSAQDSLKSQDDVKSVLSVFLVVLVALVLAYAISSMQSARRVAEDAEHDLRLLIDGAGDTALFKLDNDGRVATWNAGAERLLGYTSQQAIGLDLSTFLTADENENGKATTMLATGARGVVYEDEDWRVRKDGSLLWAHSTLTPMRDANGELRGYAHVIRDLSEHKRLEDHLSVLALRDSLTHLPNRVLFLQHLDGAIARGRRKDTTLSLLFLDLDDFKAVNDNFGHQAGDEALVRVADRLRNAVRASDFVARLGGDEFTVLCENVSDKHEAGAVARRILDAFNEPFTVLGSEVLLTASIGIAVAKGDSATAETLLNQADAAMYSAKTEIGPAAHFWRDDWPRRADSVSPPIE